VKAALQSDKTLGGNAFDVRLQEMTNIGAITLGEQQYLAAEFSAIVYADKEKLLKFAATDFDISIAALTSVTACSGDTWTFPGNSLRLPLLVIQHAATLGAFRTPA
jgi:hypothetical protein